MYTKPARTRSNPFLCKQFLIQTTNRTQQSQRDTAMASSSSTEPKPIPIKTAARNKLPVKRKTPSSPHHPNPNNPNPTLNLLSSNPNPNLTPIPFTKTGNQEEEEEDDDDDLDLNLKNPEQQPPPPPPHFKFHRIWTESDEIRFLQRLHDSTAEGLIFPRDLHLFYQRFSGSMSKSYTKAQFSEKLRRLRRKFRVISARISRGLDPCVLAPHDRAIFDLCKQLWDPSNSSLSPSQGSGRRKATGVKRIKFNFSPSPSCSSLLKPEDSSVAAAAAASGGGGIENDDEGDDYDEEEEGDNDIGNNVENGHELNAAIGGGGGSGSGSDQILAKIVVDVFDQSLGDVRELFVRRGLLNSDQGSTGSAGVDAAAAANSSDEPSKQDKSAELMMRCREQRFMELDVLARRMRLVLENSTHDH